MIITTSARSSTGTLMLSRINPPAAPRRPACLGVLQNRSNSSHTASVSGRTARQNTPGSTTSFRSAHHKAGDHVRQSFNRTIPGYRTVRKPVQIPALDPTAVAEGIATTLSSNIVSKAIEEYINVMNETSQLNESEVKQIKDKAEGHQVLPKPPSGVLPLEETVRSELTKLVCTSYKRTNGDTQVVYAEPSIGKTTAFQCLTAHYFSNVYPNAENTKALMITKYNGALDGPYLAHIAKTLGIKHEKDVIACLLAAMTTEAPALASILVLDELNDPGKDDLNILLVSVLMRAISVDQLRISLYVVTQNKEVAQKLLALNCWSKIGPLEGLTTPKRSEVKNAADVPEGDTWNSTVWTAEELAAMVLNKYPTATTSEDGSFPWIEDGMVPRKVLELAEDNLEEREQPDFSNWMQMPSLPCGFEFGGCPAAAPQGSCRA